MTSWVFLTSIPVLVLISIAMGSSAGFSEETGYLSMFVGVVTLLSFAMALLPATLVYLFFLVRGDVRSTPRTSALHKLAAMAAVVWTILWAVPSVATIAVVCAGPAVFGGGVLVFLGFCFITWLSVMGPLTCQLTEYPSDTEALGNRRESFVE